MTPKRSTPRLGPVLTEWNARQAIPLIEAVAARVEALRIERDWTQEELARRAQIAGLDTWDRNVVAAVERGKRELSVAELFLLLVTFRTDEIAFFGDDHPPIELSRSFAVEPGGLRAILAGKGWLTPAEENELLEQWRAQDTAPTLAERRMAASLKVSPAQVRAAADRAWGRTITEERSARLEERTAGNDHPKDERRTLLGHVTRELREELETDAGIRRAQRRRKP